MIIDRFWLCSSDHRALKSCEKLVLPHGSIMLRAASESSLSFKSGPSLGKSFSLAQVPLRKLELRALSLLVTVYCLQQNSDVSIRAWEKQLCSNCTFCTGTSVSYVSLQNLWGFPPLGADFFLLLSYPASLAFCLPFHSFLSMLFCWFFFF